MSDEFKRILTAYEKGELTGKDLEDFESELEKLEAYQAILEDEPDNHIENKFDLKKQQKIMRRAKWKARFQTAFNAIGMIILLTIVTSILTGAYYSWGDPNRAEVYGNVIDHTLTITDPYGQYGRTSTSTSVFFNMDATRDLNKRVGTETSQVGNLEINFLFSMMSHPERTDIGKVTQERPMFLYPTTSNDSWSDWDRLEQLPEGTVVSAYISFSELLESREVESLFTDKPIDLLWLAVDTGEPMDEDHGLLFDPIGFPSSPIWHDDDFIVESREETGGLFGSGTVSETSSSPEYKEGNQTMLHEQFTKTLSFLQDHQRKVEQLAFGIRHLDEQINYLKEEGISHYGAVITGPTKEILKLQDEPVITRLEVDEVELWNWESFE